jgi:uncharacterized protein HemX
MSEGMKKALKYAVVAIAVAMAIIFFAKNANGAQQQKPTATSTTSTVPATNPCLVNTKRMTKNLKRFYSTQCKLEKEKERIRQQFREFRENLAKPVVIIE